MLKTDSANTKLLNNQNYNIGGAKPLVASSETGILSENNANKSVSFFSEDWSASVARKLGMNDFADWIDNKEAEENPEKAKDESFISKGLREMVKHPVLTTLSIATLVIGGAQLFKTLNKPAANQISEVAKIAEPTAIAPKPQEIVKKVVPLEPTPENIQKLNEKVFSGIRHQSSIEYADFEALKNLSKQQKESLVTFLEVYPDRGREFLRFISGERPAILEGTKCCSINTFSGMRTDDLIVSAFFRDEMSNLLMNKNAVSKIVSANKTFFQQRLGLPAGCSVEDIERLIFRSSGSPLAKQNAYEDLILMIQGHDKYNAMHGQIVKDLKARYFLFHPCQVKDIDEYRTLLKESVLSKRSAYYTMDQAFKDDLIKKINTLSESSLRKIVVEPIEVFKTPQSEKEKFASLVSFSQKLEDAKLHGKPIKFG